MRITDLSSIINNMDASPELPVTVNVKYGEDNTHELVEIDNFRQYSDMFVLNVSAMGGMLRKIRDFRQWLIDEEERRMRVPDKETLERDDDEAVEMPELMAARYHLEDMFPFLKKK